MTNTKQTVAVLGASENPERYSNLAVKALLENGHTVCPVSPKCEAVHGLRCFDSLQDLPQRPQTLTLYLSPKRSTPLSDEILAAAPARIIFNPGTENPELRQRAEDAGIDCIEACTLVLLRTGQF